MTYALEIKPSCKKCIIKACKKNPVLENAIKNKIEHIQENPQQFKPLQYDLAGERRVHIMKSFVLKNTIDESAKTITLLFFGHHDEAYKR